MLPYYRYILVIAEIYTYPHTHTIWLDSSYRSEKEKYIYMNNQINVEQLKNKTALKNEEFHGNASIKRVSYKSSLKIDTRVSNDIFRHDNNQRIIDPWQQVIRSMSEVKGNIMIFAR